MVPVLLVVSHLLACAERQDGGDANGTPTAETDDTGPCPTLFADSDLDGFGDAAVSVERCDAKAGYVDNDDDCDDTSAAVHPDAVEVCDELDVDEDCDSLADDADTAAGMMAWHADTDGDGFGDAPAVSACDAPPGYVLDGTDCDDGSAAVHPDAVESCGDGLDNDCLGGDEACDLPADIEDAVVQWVGEGDGFGAALPARTSPATAWATSSSARTSPAPATKAARTSSRGRSPARSI